MPGVGQRRATQQAKQQSGVCNPTSRLVLESAATLKATAAPMMTHTAPASVVHTAKAMSGFQQQPLPPATHLRLHLLPPLLQQLPLLQPCAAVSPHALASSSAPVRHHESQKDSCIMRRVRRQQASNVWVSTAIKTSAHTLQRQKWCTASAADTLLACSYQQAAPP